MLPFQSIPFVEEGSSPGQEFALAHVPQTGAAPLAEESRLRMRCSQGKTAMGPVGCHAGLSGSSLPAKQYRLPAGHDAIG